MEGPACSGPGLEAERLRWVVPELLGEEAADPWLERGRLLLKEEEVVAIALEEMGGGVEGLDLLRGWGWRGIGPVEGSEWWAGGAIALVKWLRFH
jgi:hypothetical protein